MATTLINRIEDYVGGRNTSTSGAMKQTDWEIAISQWLSTTSREIFEIMPESRLRNVAPTKSTWTTSTQLLAKGKKIFSVENSGGKKARLVDVSDLSKYNDSSSLYYATTNDPVYTIDGGYIKLFEGGSEAGGTLHYIETPTVYYSDTEITYFPFEYEDVVVIGAAIKARIRQLNDKRKELEYYRSEDGGEDMELASMTGSEIQAMQGELQALKEEYNRTLEVLRQ